MAKNVFRPQDIMYNSRKVFIEPPKIVAEEAVEEVAAVEETGEYTGPTADDLRRLVQILLHECHDGLSPNRCCAWYKSSGVSMATTGLSSRNPSTRLPAATQRGM